LKNPYITCIVCITLALPLFWGGELCAMGAEAEKPGLSRLDAEAMCTLTAGETRALAAGKIKHVYRIVQFDGPIEESWKQNLAVVAEIFDYIPEFAFIVRVPADRVATLCGLAHVKDIDLIDPKMKLGRGTFAGKHQPFRVTLFPGEDPDPVIQRVRSLGGELLESSASASSSKTWGIALTIELSAGRIGELADLQAVRRVEPVGTRRIN
jgi:hypothetical protein